MVHRPHSLEILWGDHHHLLWWLIAGMTLVAVLFIGVGVTGKTLW